jgi:flavin-binding protein dodecin
VLDGAVNAPRIFEEERPMMDKTYKLIELVGVSDQSSEDAIQTAIARAGQSLKGIDWFEVTEIRGLVRDGRVSQFQVKLKVGFRLMADEELRAA